MLIKLKCQAMEYTTSLVRGHQEKETQNYFSMYSVSSLILAYPNSQKQDYNIILQRFNDIHIVINGVAGL